MTRRPDSKTGRLRAALLDLLEEHRDMDTIPTSARFLFYELVSLGIVSKDKTGARRPDQDMSDALTDLRHDGIVLWQWIVDETRQLVEWEVARTVAVWLQRGLERAAIDPWHDDPPLILTESRSLAGVLRGLAAEYRVPIASTNGQCGGFLRTEVGPALRHGQTVLYLGDLDWQGNQIEANTWTVLEDQTGGLAWERLAITQEQADEYGLPAIDKPDRRYRPVRYHPAIETEALRQDVIVSIVRDRLDELLPEPLDGVLERETAERAAVGAALERLQIPRANPYRREREEED